MYLIQQAIDRVADSAPDHEALRIYNDRLSYRQLAERSNSLAHTLVNKGVKRGDRVGIYLNKSLESVIAIYGILKAGAAYVPLDPSAPPSRVSFMIGDCGIQHLVTEKSKTARLAKILQEGLELSCIIGIQPNDTLPVDCLSWDQVYQSPSDGPPAVKIIEQDLAYIIYTSGSTGTPKGIMHTHRSSLSFSQWAAAAYGLRPEDRLSNQAPLHFDMSIFDLFAAAVAGATTVIIPDEYMRLPASYAKLLADEKVSVFFTVPFALSQLLFRGVLENHDFGQLRWIVFGGDTHSPAHIRSLMELLSTTRFSHMYGPAETNGCTYLHLEQLPSEDQPIPIGNACENMEGLVLDADDKPVGAGQSGELLMRTPSMMLGYWNRPDLNAGVFFRREVFEGFTELFYRTGDLVEILEDGQYRFIGRKDRQIKVRGYRVELDEIETLLLSGNRVEEAAAYPLEKADGAKVIEVAVKLDAGVEFDSVAMLKFLKSRLPWYAVPDKIVAVEAFPRTGSGKISRRELQRLALQRK